MFFYTSSSATRTAPITMGEVAVTEIVFAQTAFRGPVSYAPRLANNVVFSEESPSFAVSYPEVVATNTFLTQTAFRDPMAFVPRVGAQEVFITESARGNPVVGIGTTAPSVIVPEPPLFTETGTRGAFSCPRTASNTLFTQTAFRGPMAFVNRTAGHTLFNEWGQGPAFGIVTPAPSPNEANQLDPFQSARQFLSQWLELQGGQMAPSKLLDILDIYDSSYHINELQQTANRLAQAKELIVGDDGISGTVYGLGDEAAIVKLGPAADQAALNASPDTVNNRIYSIFYTALASFLASLDGGAYTSLNAYATYQNGVMRDSFLIGPNAAYQNWLYVNKKGSLLLTPSNVFAPKTTFGTVVVGASAGVVTYTNLTTIPTANVQTDQTGQQGYTPAPGVTANIAIAINNTLAITVTGDGRRADGTAFTGHTWTGTLDNATANSAIALTPTVAGDRISAVTGVSAAGAATAGGFSLVSVLERITG